MKGIVFFLKTTKRVLVISVASYGIGTSKYAYNAQTAGHLIKVEYADLFLISVGATIQKANVLLVTLDTIYLRVFALFLLSITYNLKTLAVRFGIGNLISVYNVHSGGILERMENARRFQISVKTIMIKDIAHNVMRAIRLRIDHVKW